MNSFFLVIVKSFHIYHMPMYLLRCTFNFLLDSNQFSTIKQGWSKIFNFFYEMALKVQEEIYENRNLGKEMQYHASLKKNNVFGKPDIQRFKFI